MPVDPGQVGLSILDAFRSGQADREKREYKSALGGYAMNPSEEGLGALAQYNPEFVIQERGRLAQQRKAEQVAQIGQQALKGDPNAMQQLFQADPDLWKRLDDRQREELKRTNTYMGQAAMQIGRLPEEQRGQAWATAVQQAEAGGMDIPDYLEAYRPESLDTAVRMAGVVENYIKQFEPDYMAVPEGALLVDTKNPSAVRAAAGMGNAPAGDIPTVASPADASRLPPGSQFKTPDGRIMRVPGGGAGNGAGSFPLG